MRMLPVSLAIGAFLGGASTAHAQAEIQLELTSETRYVEITGETFQEVFDSINRYVLHNQEFSVDISYNFLTDGQAGGPCPLSWAVITAHTIVRLPRWAGENRPPRQIRRDYERWEEGMEAHGQDHIAITRTSAERIAAQLSNFPVSDDCSYYQMSMQQAAHQVWQVVQSDQVQFHNDDERRHQFRR